jgi:arginase
MDNLTFLENKKFKDKEPSSIAVLSIPLNIGSQNLETTGVFEYLKGLGLETALASSGYRVSTLPEISLSTIPETAIATSKVVKDAISKGNKVLAIGGDHAIAIGTVAGATEAFGEDVGLIWIDAHADINTHDTSPTGNIHGMVSSTLLGLGRKELTDLVKTKIKKENILYIGLRDIDQSEIDILRKENLRVVTMMDILQHGFQIVTKNIDGLNKRVGNVWVSLDIDTIDEACSPAVAMATPGGLSYREAVSLLTYIGKASPVVGMDIVEVTPKKDINNKTGLLCLELIAAAFGGKYDSYRRYILKYA